MRETLIIIIVDVIIITGLLGTGHVAVSWTACTSFLSRRICHVASSVYVFRHSTDFRKKKETRVGKEGPVPDAVLSLHHKNRSTQHTK